MQTVQFVTIKNKTKPVSEREVLLWCTTNDLKMFRDFMQYVLDNVNNPQEFMLIDVKKKKVYDMYRVATEMYKMRKRTFEERMNNIQTGKWFGVDM